jgi:hypothetical protein
VSLADRGLKPFGALKGESGKASHLRGFSLVGAPGLNRGPSSPPGCFNRVAGGTCRLGARGVELQRGLEVSAEAARRRRLLGGARTSALMRGTGRRVTLGRRLVRILTCL